MDVEEAPPGRDAKFSWEVIRDNSIFTYRIDLVPAYAEVMAALQVRNAAEARANRSGRIRLRQYVVDDASIARFSSKARECCWYRQQEHLHPVCVLLQPASSACNVIFALNVLYALQ